MLVVISIIALLLAILVPSLNKARELARKIICANNLKTMGMGDRIYSQECDDWHVPIFAWTTPPPTDVLWFQNPLFVKIIAMKGRFNREVSEGYNSASKTLPQEYKCPTDKRTVANGGLLLNKGDNSVEGVSYGMNSVGLRAIACNNGWCRVVNKPHTLKASQVVRPSDKFFFMDAEWFAVHWVSANYLVYWDLIGDKMSSDEWDMPAYRHREGANMVFYDGHVKYLSKKEVFKVDIDNGLHQAIMNMPTWFPITNRLYIDPPYN